MYFIKEITVKDDIYQSSKIVEISESKKLSELFKLMTNCALSYVKYSKGETAALNCQIIEATDESQIVKPLTDCIVLYKFANDSSYKIYAYENIIRINPGYIFGSSTETIFTRTKIFEYEEYINEKKSNTQTYDEHEKMIEHGIAKIKIPEGAFSAPRPQLLAELKLSSSFLKRKEITDNLPGVGVRTIFTND
jgi:hypothetical protein